MCTTSSGKTYIHQVVEIVCISDSLRDDKNHWDLGLFENSTGFLLESRHSGYNHHNDEHSKAINNNIAMICHDYEGIL